MLCICLNSIKEPAENVVELYWMTRRTTPKHFYRAETERGSGWGAARDSACHSHEDSGGGVGVFMTPHAVRAVVIDRGSGITAMPGMMEYIRLLMAFLFLSALPFARVVSTVDAVFFYVVGKANWLFVC